MDRDTAINDFLNSFDTLETLTIFAPKTGALRPELCDVANHQKNLRSLYLDCGFDNVGSFYGYEDIEEYLSRCEKLEQLALIFPSTFLESDEEAFEAHDELGIFTVFLAHELETRDY